MGFTARPHTTLVVSRTGNRKFIWSGLNINYEIEGRGYCVASDVLDCNGTHWLLAAMSFESPTVPMHVQLYYGTLNEDIPAIKRLGLHLIGRVRC